MEIHRNGSQASSKGPADWFTGTVRIDPQHQQHDSIEVEPDQMVWLELREDAGRSERNRALCAKHRLGSKADVLGLGNRHIFGHIARADLSPLGIQANWYR